MLFHNDRPYKVLNKCFRIKNLDEWREYTEHLFYAAAYRDSVYSVLPNTDIDPYIYNRCLFKLLEACHLLVVRTQ